MIYESEEMKRMADRILSDYDDGRDVTNRINLYLTKYINPFCEECKTEFIPFEHDCEQQKRDKEDERAEEQESIKEGDYI